MHARRAGATLVIVNLEPTRADTEADLVIRAGAGPVMAAVLASVAGAQAPPRRRGEPVTARVRMSQGG